jgi:hypothetical protein
VRNPLDGHTMAERSGLRGEGKREEEEAVAAEEEQ